MTTRRTDAPHAGARRRALAARGAARRVSRRRHRLDALPARGARGRVADPASGKRAASPSAWAWLRPTARRSRTRSIRAIAAAPLHEELLDWFESETDGRRAACGRRSPRTPSGSRFSAPRLRDRRGKQGQIHHLTELGSLAEPRRPRRLPTADGRAGRPRAAGRDPPNGLGAVAGHGRELRERPGCVAVPRRPRLRRGGAGRIVRRVLPGLARRRQPRRASSSPSARTRTIVAADSRLPSAASRSSGCERRAHDARIVYSLEGSEATALYESIGMREHARSVELVKRR